MVRNSRSRVFWGFDSPAKISRFTELALVPIRNGIARCSFAYRAGVSVFRSDHANRLVDALNEKGPTAS